MRSSVIGIGQAEGGLGHQFVERPVVEAAAGGVVPVGGVDDPV